MSVNPSVFLFLAAILAIIFANTGLKELYDNILNAPVTLEVWGYSFFKIAGRPMTAAEFINDALMAIFFFSVGLEIKREMTIGSLSSFKKALLPVVAAFGGIIVPVLVFLSICHTEPVMRGMAIPMATDIAFALAVLGLLGKRVPATLKIFLMALAVVDDIVGILVIAIFYSSGINVVPLVLGLSFVLIAYILGQKGVVRSGIYYFIFFIVWSLFLHSGIHTTIAGVLLALSIPYKPTIRPRDLREDLKLLTERVEIACEPDHVVRDFLSDDEIEEILRTERRLLRSISPVQIMEQQTNAFVNYVVLPLFAFANAGVALGGVSASELFGLPLAIFLGLFVGKTIGIFGFTCLFSKLKLIHLSPGITKWNLFGVSIFGGIGFTVSLFIATLAYSGLGETGEILLNEAKLGIFAGTIVSGIVGVLVLSTILKKEKKHNKGAYSKEYIDYMKTAVIDD
ncbi:Na+/H+ antiporter NhaA [Porphyromonadaceae bacterium W3.11]|nr:Na+/H+ antiporter NhaA [Porphyromonadaceae bacterium W3.11]